MAFGLGSAIILAGGTYAVWGRKAKFASLAALMTGAILYGVYEWKLREREAQLGLKASGNTQNLSICNGEIRID